MRDEYVTHWTNKEGGTWLACDFPLPSENQLSVALMAVRGKGGLGLKVTDTLKRKPLHSFRTSAGREWDVINGWRERTTFGREG